MKKTLPLLAVILAGCASNPPMGNVMPLDGGRYQVDGLGSSSDAALKSALYSAETTCKAQNKRHIITGQKSAYKGTVSEDANRAIENVAQVVSAVTGSWVPTLSNDDDYRITLSFKCDA